MTSDTAKRCIDWVKWYNEHKNEPMSVKNRYMFLTKCMDGVFELMSLILLDVHEHTTRIKNDPRLIIPFKELIKRG